MHKLKPSEWKSGHVVVMFGIYQTDLVQLVGGGGGELRAVVVRSPWTLERVGWDDLGDGLYRLPVSDVELFGYVTPERSQELTQAALGSQPI